MLRREHHVGCAEHRIGTCGEDLDLRAVAVLRSQDRKAQDGPLASADPVLLCLLGRLGPVEILEIVEQPLHVLRDPEEPLRDAPLFDGCTAAFTPSRDHLLVRQDRHTRGTPVDRRFLAHGQPRVEELDEDPLCPSVVFGIRRVDRMVPVEHPTHTTKLPDEVGHVRRDEVHRVNALFQGEVLGVDTERIEADRLEDLLAGEPLEASVDVRARERKDVAHVEPLGGGVREHHQLVVAVLGGLEGVTGEGVRAPLIPSALPLSLYFGRCIAAVSVAAHLYLREAVVREAVVRERGPCRRPREGYAAGSAKKSSQANFAPNLYRGRGHHNASKPAYYAARVRTGVRRLPDSSFTGTLTYHP